MTTFQPSSFLRRVLAVDALSCAAMGILLLSFAPLCGDLFALSTDLLRGAGLVLLPCAAYLAFLASRSSMPRAFVWIAIVANGLWFVESVITLLSSAVQPTALGYAFVLGQAAIVAVLTELEVLGVMRASRRLAAA